jgi:NADH-quinone oxidoreductase subunit K
MPIYPYFFISTTLFFFGMGGIILNRTNILILLMCIELILLGVNLNFILFSKVFEDSVGQVFSIFIIAVATAESAIGLAILVAYYRLRGHISIRKAYVLRG